MQRLMIRSLAEKIGRLQRMERCLLRIGKLVEGSGLPKMIPFADIVPVIIIPVEVARQHILLL